MDLAQIFPMGKRSEVGKTPRGFKYKTYIFQWFKLTLVKSFNNCIADSVSENPARMRPSEQLSSYLEAYCSTLVLLEIPPLYVFYPTGMITTVKQYYMKC